MKRKGGRAHALERRRCNPPRCLPSLERSRGTRSSLGRIQITRRLMKEDRQGTREVSSTKEPTYSLKKEEENPDWISISLP
nr:hypothetical protein CFP56_20737 [Quercus suber]